MKSEGDRRQIFEKWPVDKNQMAGAGFCKRNSSDVVCRVDLGHCQIDDPFKDHER